MPFCTHRRLRCAVLALFLCTVLRVPAQQPVKTGKFPFNEKLTYNVEWRLINAGEATVQLFRNNSSQNWDFKVDIQSAGLVNRLYRVQDAYQVSTTDRFCGVHVQLDAEEGKRHSTSAWTFDNHRHKLLYEENNITRNTKEKKELDIGACTYEIVGALSALRTASLEPGKSVTLSMTDGKKAANVRIDAQARENIIVDGKTRSAIRYEAFLFDSVLYKKRGRLLIWLSDEPDHVPLEFRLLMGFPIGTITIDLQKQEKFG